MANDSKVPDSKVSEPNEEVLGLIHAQNAKWVVKREYGIWTDDDREVYVASCGTPVLAAYIVATHNAVLARIELGAR